MDSHERKEKNEPHVEHNRMPFSFDLAAAGSGVHGVESSRLEQTTEDEHIVEQFGAILIYLLYAPLQYIHLFFV